jgi:regulator of nucleoside diphosphate kinase
MSSRDRTCLTDLDAIRLRSVARQLIGARGDPRLQGEELFDLLDAADVVPANAITADVITMNSTVVYDDSDNGRSDTLTLVYPDQADITRGCVSVLSPLGRRLIGARVGERVSFEAPGGGLRNVLVREVVYQPEAAGEWML